MAAGRFRRDLYYRLSGATLHIPPLRARPADIVALVEFFATRYAESAKLPRPEFPADVMAAMVAHPWPGNVRELKNVVQRTTLLTRGRPVGIAISSSTPLPPRTDRFSWTRPRTHPVFAAPRGLTRGLGPRRPIRPPSSEPGRNSSEKSSRGTSGPASSRRFRRPMAIRSSPLVFSAYPVGRSSIGSTRTISPDRARGGDLPAHSRLAGPTLCTLLHATCVAPALGVHR